MLSILQIPMRDSMPYLSPVQRFASSWRITGLKIRTSPRVKLLPVLSRGFKVSERRNVDFTHAVSAIAIWRGSLIHGLEKYRKYCLSRALA